MRQFSREFLALIYVFSILGKRKSSLSAYLAKEIDTGRLPQVHTQTVNL